MNYRSSAMTGARILVVEDEKDILEMICINLIRDGYRVTTSSSVGEALALLRIQPFDLLLTDNFLPDGLGTELIRQLDSIQRNFNIQTVLMTAGSELDAWDDDLIADVLLPKPFSLQDFRKLIRNLLEARVPQRLTPRRNRYQVSLRLAEV